MTKTGENVRFYTPMIATQNNIGDLVMSNLTTETSEQKSGFVSAEFIAEREKYYVNRSDKKVWLGCGDDRSVTSQSAQVLAETEPDAMVVTEGYASMFGATCGIAKNVLVVGVAQYGPEFVDQIGGFEGAFNKVIEGMQADDSTDAILPALHSGDKNENNPARFNPNADGKVACAYAEGVGATSDLLVDPNTALIRDQARTDQIAIFGTANGVDKLLDAHKIVLETATDGKGGNFVVSREAYNRSGLPIMILAGSHTSAKKSGYINNFMPHKVRNSTAANADGNDFYSNDITDVTLATLRAFKEYNLDPELLMRAFVLDSTPVRAVLAAGDADPELHGKLDARNVPMGVLGDPHEALAYLTKM